VKRKEVNPKSDYWAIDWDYKGETFRNLWQSFRMKKNPDGDEI
jgi:adenine-specific DNA-methyltransferase